MTEEAAGRQALVDASRRLDALGLNQGRAGNVGLRIGGGALVTPSGIPPAALEPGHIVAVDPEGVPAAGQLVPTSEWRLHAAVLAARPDVGAVVHTHSPELTAMACLGRPLPAIHYVIARAGGSEVPCAQYATYGSAELAANVVATLGAGWACLMANHGALAVGATLDAAVALAADLEWLAGVHRRAVSMGIPVVLSDDEIARVAVLFETYGQP
ncbi:MAG TPA: class II aldolase/adducin family protein [Acidimicrobiales bacterium]